jgi:hypothetical protein
MDYMTISDCTNNTSVLAAVGNCTSVSKAFVFKRIFDSVDDKV